MKFLGMTLTAVLAFGQMASAELVENGSSFRGHFKVEGTQRECGYAPSIPNTILGEVEINAGTDGLSIDAIVDDYSKGGGVVSFFSFRLANRPPFEVVKYVSSSQLVAHTEFRFNNNDPVRITDSEVTVDGDRVTVKQTSNLRAPLDCHYTRIK